MVGRFCFPTDLDLADILGRMDFDFENFYFFIFLDSKFLDFQVPRYLKSRLGRAGLGGSAVLGRGGGRRTVLCCAVLGPDPGQI